MAITSPVIKFGYQNISNGPYITYTNILLNSLDFNYLEIKVKSIANKEWGKKIILYSDNPILKNNELNIIKIQESNNYIYFDFIINNEIMYSAKHILNCEMQFVFNNSQQADNYNSMFEFVKETLCDK
jgi:hypothetical protein